MLNNNMYKLTNNNFYNVNFILDIYIYTIRNSIYKILTVSVRHCSGL